MDLKHRVIVLNNARKLAYQDDTLPEQAQNLGKKVGFGISGDVQWHDNDRVKGSDGKLTVIATGCMTDVCGNATAINQEGERTEANVVEMKLIRRAKIHIRNPKFGTKFNRFRKVSVSTEKNSRNNLLSTP